MMVYFINRMVLIDFVRLGRSRVQWKELQNVQKDGVVSNMINLNVQPNGAKILTRDFWNRYLLWPWQDFISRLGTFGDTSDTEEYIVRLVTENGD